MFRHLCGRADIALMVTRCLYCVSLLLFPGVLGFIAFNPTYAATSLQPVAGYAGESEQKSPAGESRDPAFHYERGALNRYRCELAYTYLLNDC